MSGMITKSAGEGVATPCDPALTPDQTGGPAVTLTATLASRYPFGGVA